MIRVYEPSRNLAECKVVKKGPGERENIPETLRGEQGGDTART